MSVIFISHSSRNNPEAVALRDWLVSEGWNDLFLDLDPHHGIHPGQRWERALNEAALRCEAVLFLVSSHWLESEWCLKELKLARRLNKQLFGLLIEEQLDLAILPSDLKGTWQLVNLASGRDHRMFRIEMPVSGEEFHVTFSREGLARLKTGLQQAGLDARFFAWPPQGDEQREPFRGLQAFEAEDAGIFFGREGPIYKLMGELRGLAQSAPPRLVVILGASGSGKSSFLRAGILPRVARDSRTFVSLPPVRPERAAISGERGLVNSLADAFHSAGIALARAEIREAVEKKGEKLTALLRRLYNPVDSHSAESDEPRQQAIVLAVDQAEELFPSERNDEAVAMLSLLKELLLQHDTAVIVIMTIRSGIYERLQHAEILSEIPKSPFDLSPMPKGVYVDVIRRPIERLTSVDDDFQIDDDLVDAMLQEIESGGASDALPLLSFTLRRLYQEYGATRHLTFDQYEKLGRISGSIEAAVGIAFEKADLDARIPKDRDSRLTLLRRGLIPWLAGIDLQTLKPRRRVARYSEIPLEARPLIDLLVEQRLLTTYFNKESEEQDIEPTHEAFLRRWGSLQGWLEEDMGLLAALDGIKRAARDWGANNNEESWLVHDGERLLIAESLLARQDLAAGLHNTERHYLETCRAKENQEEASRAAVTRFRRRVLVVVFSLMAMVISGLLAWINQQYIKDQWHWFTVERPFLEAVFEPRRLSRDAEQALTAGASFRECRPGHCPEMVVIPPGSFKMGSDLDEKGHKPNELPQHRVEISERLAVGKFPVTFDEWDTCAEFGDCRKLPRVDDATWGRGTRPVIYVKLDEVQTYIDWLSKATGKPYRLLSEAEHEYATRAGSETRFPWGNTFEPKNANCADCTGPWAGRGTTPVGKTKNEAELSRPPNRFGLYDMVGNTWEWVEDCYHPGYEVETANGTEKAPADGSAWMTGDCSFRVARGGSWKTSSEDIRSASRSMQSAGNDNYTLGFRVARELD